MTKREHNQILTAIECMSFRDNFSREVVLCENMVALLIAFIDEDKDEQIRNE